MKNDNTNTNKKDRTNPSKNDVEISESMPESRDMKKDKNSSSKKSTK